MQNAAKIFKEVKKAVIGKDEIIHKILMVMLANGHVLLEDIPGVGKTNLALAFSKALGLDTKRIQFTPDVMPSDVIGYSFYNQQTGALEYKEGAAMCNLLLADEINRTSSKTQSALLEVMEEGRMSVDGITHSTPQPFMVIATQNPFGSAGTQLLPQSQMDRFMVCLSIGYPSKDAEIEILKRKERHNPLDDIETVSSPSEILMMQKEISSIYLDESIYHYIVDLINATRSHPLILQGGSPRSTLALMQVAKAVAYTYERDYVIPEDVEAMFLDILSHRIVLNNEARLDKSDPKKILTKILKETPRPRIIR
ncbi:MAG: AAA family ATPase [Beduini sp.]|uniref:AAA family ATPase n=1 Tax=Beduini sp. TaxID=1922300 RepID=UPI0039A3C71B